MYKPERIPKSCSRIMAAHKGGTVAVPMQLACYTDIHTGTEEEHMTPQKTSVTSPTTFKQRLNEALFPLQTLAQVFSNSKIAKQTHYCRMVLR